MQNSNDFNGFIINNSIEDDMIFLIVTKIIFSNILITFT